MNSVFDNLVSALGRLPGVGRRSAERMAVRLVTKKNTLLKDVLKAIEAADAGLCCCSMCGAITSPDSNPCRLCRDTGRDSTILCVVEDPGDIALIEKSGAFRGRYHALMGKISPASGSGPSDLRVEALAARVRDQGVGEILLAMNTDMESDATAAYIREKLSDLPVRISRLAFGLPVGSGVAYSDALTLSRAIRGRQPV